MLTLLFCSNLTRSYFGLQHPPKHEVKDDEKIEAALDAAHKSVKTVTDEFLAAKKDLAEIGTPK